MFRRPARDAFAGLALSLVLAMNGFAQVPALRGPADTAPGDPEEPAAGAETAKESTDSAAERKLEALERRFAPPEQNPEVPQRAPTAPAQRGEAAEREPEPPPPPGALPGWRMWAGGAVVLLILAILLRSSPRSGAS